MSKGPDKILFGLVFLLASMPFAHSAEPLFRSVQPQYIAALGDAAANAGNNADTWGIWVEDPGPRGVWLKYFPLLKAAEGNAPAGWTFDANDWWLDENGLIMEKPEFPLPAGQYLVTGGREVTTVLSVEAPDTDGKQQWSLAKDAKLAEVTHLPCRSARYIPLDSTSACSPTSAPKRAFKVPPGSVMPEVTGCAKQDYRVLIVIGIPVEVMSN